jgi:hypothetical protein
MTEEELSTRTTNTEVAMVARALTEAGYVSEPDPANNSTNAPAYLKVFCQGIPKSKRVDYVNLVFGGTGGTQVKIEGEETTYPVPAKLKALVERVRHNLPCA